MPIKHNFIGLAHLVIYFFQKKKSSAQDIQYFISTIYHLVSDSSHDSPSANGFRQTFFSKIFSDNKNLALLGRKELLHVKKIDIASPLLII